jgi:hypothetical protein
MKSFASGKVVKKRREALAAGKGADNKAFMQINRDCKKESVLFYGMRSERKRQIFEDVGGYASGGFRG